MAYDCKLIECYPGFGPELTVDGNMENDPTTNWSGTGANVAEELLSIHAGCIALEVTATAAPGSARQTVTVEAGHKYRIGVWGLCPVGTEQWRVAIYATTVRWTSAWHNNNAAWEEEVKFYRIPDGITSIELRLEVDQINDVVFFDDVSVKRESLVSMTEIDLLFRATDDWAILDQGISINDPAIKELWGGELEDQLVRREEGKRVIPMELHLLSADADTLIDDVNGLEAMLRHAAAFRTEGKRSGYGETFLQFKTDNATHYVWYPVIAGRIDKRNLMKKCNSEQEIDNVPATIICEAYWESLFTYDLSNLLDNPGFEEWNNGICNSQPDCWTDYQTAGAAGENQQETDTVEEGCEALRIELIAAAAGLYQGVTQNIGARVRADTEYTLLARVQNEAIVNGKLYVFVEGAAAAVRGTAINDGLARADYTLVSCQFTPLTGDIAANVHIRVRLEAVGGACTAIAHIDKMLVMESSNVPTGWMSSSYLVNHYDGDAGHINYLSVCDVPGEVEAECEIEFHPVATLSGAHIIRRSIDNPCNMLWQLTPCNAATKLETGAGGACTPGNTDAFLFDSDKVIDATSPDGSHINVDFLTAQTMETRAYWHLTQNLGDYKGAYQFLLLCKKTLDTDTVKVKIGAFSGVAGSSQGYVVSQEAETAVAGDWNLMSGWNLLSWPVGESLDLWGAGNYWSLRVEASIDGAAPWDNLQIAGAYLALLDERYVIAGSPISADMGANDTIYVRDLDGKRGYFSYDGPQDRHDPNRGYVGRLPALEPSIENWFHFAFVKVNTVDIDEGATVSVTHRPRGIFLRGSNP